MGYIYKIINDINDKVYIGKTVNSIEKRWKEHCFDSKKRSFEKRPLYNAMNKYGIEHFYIELVEECSEDILDNREIYWIEYYHSYSNGYNATFGGEGKVLYDYEYIVDLYKEGKLIKDITKELGCDSTVVQKALNLYNFDTKQNQLNKIRKKIKGTFPDGMEKTFISITEAALFLQENGYTKAKALNGIQTNISRVANHNSNRKSYLKIKWEFIND